MTRRCFLLRAVLDAGADADAPAQLGIIPLGVAGSSRTTAAALALHAGYELSLNAVLRRSSPLVVADTLVQAARATTRQGAAAAALAARRRLLAVVLRCPAVSQAVIEDAAAALTVDLARARAKVEVLRAEAAAAARLAAGAEADGQRGAELAAAAATKRSEIDEKARGASKNGWQGICLTIALSPFPHGYRGRCPCRRDRHHSVVRART